MAAQAEAKADAAFSSAQAAVDKAQQAGDKADTAQTAVEGISNARITKAGLVYLPTASELTSGKPDAGREALPIALPLGGAQAIGGLSTCLIKTTSGSMVIDHDGLILIWLQQGGQGGMGGPDGAKGSPGKTVLVPILVTKGTLVTYTIGSGGAGGQLITPGSAGGHTTVTVHGKTYTSATATEISTVGWWGSEVLYGDGGAGAYAYGPGGTGVQGCMVIIY